MEDLPKAKSNRIVSILGLFELSVGDAPRADGVSELAAARLAVDHVNKRGLLPGYKLHLITNDTKVSFGSTSPALSDRTEFPLFCRTVAPDSSHNPARIAFIR
ncbi:hypothetical protein HF086_006660 [Spodoptera exigua]|uniref:Receptor ligand binding region domain-containing protein n=1 Tax=Spodoptera exigua TaxID=7107 RepID=A0A922SF54_SPOEX|nr:hypothetical protein HF086_006660 [Spodoptera exigua]